MRVHEIIGPVGHPYMASLEIEPSQIASIEQDVQDDPAKVIVSVDDRHMGQWVVHVGCASRTKAAALEHWPLLS